MADTLDLLTLPEGKRAISRKLASVDQDDVIALHITAVSRIIDDRCGPVVQREVAGEEHPGGGRILVLVNRPVASIATLTESWGGSTATLDAVDFGATTDGYRAHAWNRDPSLLAGVLHRRRYGCPASWGEVQVDYIAGRVEATEDVPARFKDCAGAVLRRLWKREAGAWAQSAAGIAQADEPPGGGFFKVAAPVIDEMLWDEVQTHLAAVAR